MYIKRSLNLLQVFRFFVAQRIYCGFLPTEKFLSEKIFKEVEMEIIGWPHMQNHAN